ncbi:flagellar biosynthesis anti-sigma factor FlgM [Desulfitobacterium dichloroeliminans LMG P-21439]|uniref:Negative regulator of flagellin synthesis n=1 Tax=Desulfitobacterium dichloroeliminans (strain LMG P-21439 / DCA1) TaxID=871963 RepID=L0FBJ5_DESDL|nr:flagellar biosynthesis anti-sigma factor FlgM [Desulfitobacterium dichloroeliminans]AGA70323.1 flagellar biosynthesis anti-sigma factor FlgM [Desulfitobacterium dichloroeliminans LMG P-21439]
MKIDGTSMSSIGSVQATNRVAAVSRRVAVPGLEQDGMKVSDKGQVYQNLLQKIKEMPEVREDRIREITERINQGEFRIDAQAIAAKLLTGE